MKFKALLSLSLLSLLTQSSQAQSCLKGSLNGATLTMPCNQACTSLSFQIPHIRNTNNYTVNSITYDPAALPVSGPIGTELTALYVDDQYSAAQNLPFKFCFYGGTYTQAVIGSNGLMTFDVANASCGNAWNLTGSLPSSGGTICSTSSSYFPRASIMGVYTDLDPRRSGGTNPSPADRVIEFRTEGVAPCRRFVTTYYRVGMYGQGNWSASGINCNSLGLTTVQIIGYESTNWVEVHVGNKSCNPTTVSVAYLGLQNWNQNAAVTAPGKNGTSWNESNKAYRFLPAGTSMYKKTEVYNLNTGALVYTTVSGDTSTTTPGYLKVNIPNVCPTDSSTRYQLKTYWTNCADAANDIIVSDTVKLNLTSLSATAAVLPSGCKPSGKITVTPAPPAPGVAYLYSLNGGVPRSSNVFDSLPAGNYSVLVQAPRTFCSTYVSVNVPLVNTLATNFYSVPSGCDPSGAVVLTPKPDSGYAPFTYELLATPANVPQRDSIFKPLGVGTYSFAIKDTSGCRDTVTVQVLPRAPLTGSGITLPSGCTPSGTVSVTAAGGTAPYQFALNGGTTFGGSSTFTPLAAGTYSVTIKDSTNCIFVVPNLVVAGNPVDASATTLPSACTPSGTITVTVTPGTGVAPYTYQLGSNAPQSGNVFNPIGAGTYTIIVRDATGCADTLTATVDNLNALLATAVSTPSGCNPADGTITVTASGGTAPYTYQLDAGNPQIGNQFTGVSAGGHVVTVKDAGGCSFPVSVTVAPTPAVDITSITSTASGCVPVDGTVTVAIGGGTAPFQVKIDNGSLQSALSFTGIAAGAHTVVVIDSKGCTDTATVTVAQTPQPAGTAATTLSGCTPTGSITVTMSDGTAPYTYTVGSTTQAGNTFNGLPAGSYTVNVTDAKGCTVAIPATIGQHPALTATGTTTPSGCTPPSGTITITVPAGAGLAPFTYELDNSGTQVAGNTFNSVPSGLHAVVVRDAAGCSFTVNVTVGAPAPIVATAVTTPSGCTPSGSITINVTPGTAQNPIEYWNGPGVPQASNVFTNIGVGTYTITVRDGRGCTVDVQATVDPLQPLLAGFRTHATSCDAANNGSLVLVPQNGTAPYQYRLGASGAWQVSDSFPNLTAGNYDLYFRDASGCISPAFPATVAAGPQITATATQTNVSCFGGTNGSATLTLSGNATAPFTFSADNFTTTQAGNVFSNLGSGPHTFSFRDNYGCANTVLVTITEPTQLVAGTPVTANPRCNSATDGTVTLSATGGTAPYQYSFNGSAFQAAPLFTSGAGSFNAVIRDANNCTVNITGITLADPAQLVIDSVVIRAAACDANGSLQVFANGGTAPYRFSINSGALQNSNQFSVAGGTYDVTVRDANNCSATSAGNVVTLVSNLQYVHPVIAPICEGTKATIAPVTNATTFVWTGPFITPNNTVQSSIDVRPVRDTFYTLTYTLGSCTQKDTIPVSVNPAPIPDAGPGTTICFGQDAQLDAPAGFSEYHWSPATYLSNPDIRNPSVTRPNATIIYSLHVRDANGCASLVPDTVTIQVTPPIIVRLTPADTIGYIGDTLRITASAAATHFQWYTSLNTTPTNIVNPNLPSVLLLVEKNEVLRVHAWTDQGCSGDGFFYLRAYRGPEIYVPDAFTPNRDGRNDLLRPMSVGIQSLVYFRVFNRWGQQMYEYSGEKRGPVVYNLLQSNIGWDGKLDGKELPTGTYVWIAEGITKEGKRVTRKGAVTLIR